MLVKESSEKDPGVQALFLFPFLVWTHGYVALIVPAFNSFNRAGQATDEPGFLQKVLPAWSACWPRFEMSGDLAWIPDGIGADLRSVDLVAIFLELEAGLLK